MSEEKEKLRPVEITGGTEKGKKGFFHGFYQYADEDSSECLAVIELHDGSTCTVFVGYFKFLDRG